MLELAKGGIIMMPMTVKTRKIINVGLGLEWHKQTSILMYFWMDPEKNINVDALLAAAITFCYSSMTQITWPSLTGTPKPKKSEKRVARSTW